MAILGFGNTELLALGGEVGLGRNSVLDAMVKGFQGNLLRNSPSDPTHGKSPTFSRAQSEAIIFEFVDQINQELAQRGCPPLTLTMITRGEAQFSADFDPKKWEVRIQTFGENISAHELQILASVVYHESRHAEQYFLMASSLAARGLTADGVTNQMKYFADDVPLPKKLVDAAVANHARQDSKSIQFGAALHKREFSGFWSKFGSSQPLPKPASQAEYDTRWGHHERGRHKAALAKARGRISSLSKEIRKFNKRPPELPRNLTHMLSSPQGRKVLADFSFGKKSDFYRSYSDYLNVERLYAKQKYDQAYGNYLSGALEADANTLDARFNQKTGIIGINRVATIPPPKRWDIATLSQRLSQKPVPLTPSPSTAPPANRPRPFAESVLARVRAWTGL